MTFQHTRCTLFPHLLVYFLISSSFSLTAQHHTSLNYYQSSFLPRAGLVIMEASIDDQAGYFIIDTGNPYLIVNKSNNKRGKRTKKSFGISAPQRLVKLTIGPWVLERQSAKEIDLSDVEQKLPFPILGIIGNQVLKEFEILLDYQKPQITFYQLDEQGNKLNENLTLPAVDTLPIYFKNHLPCIRIQINQQELLVGLDTGAGISLFSKNHEQAISTNSYSAPARITGIQKKTKIKNTTVFKPQIQLGKITTIPMIALFTDLTELNQNLAGPELQGILGFGYLFQQKTAINFKKQEFYVWKRRGDVQKLSAQLPSP